MNECNYHKIVAECEQDLEKYGDTFEGVGWTKKKEYADLRYRIMLEGIRPDLQGPVRLLDFGCGASHLYEFILSKGIGGIEYAGLDLSDKYLALSRRKFPNLTFHQVDLLDPQATIPAYDYIIMNGIFTYKGGASHEAMWRYCQDLLLRVSGFARHCFAFNVMSKHLDWERNDLFHLAFDEIAHFLDARISRHFTMRHDYGLFEYTVYVYRTALSDHS
jgi:cyclopropane fatty-acyl-phospholipid synthase-like methyltransferase